MSSPSKYTANILDLMVKSLDLVLASEDISRAAEEFAMGVPLASRTLDLCWGYTPINPELAANSKKDLVLSAGVTRRAGTLATPETNEIALDIASIALMGSDKLQNVYAFGSVFMVDASPKPTIEVLLLRGGSNGAGTRLLMSKDYDVNTALTAIERGDIPAVTPPAGTVLEIVQFLADITYYDGGPSVKNQINYHFIDKRKPRGWGGYAEENMGIYLIPAMVANYSSTKDSADTAKNHVKDIVLEWVNLGWEPDFLIFWQKSGSNKMPTRLEKFLLDELGITLLA